MRCLVLLFVGAIATFSTTLMAANNDGSYCHSVTSNIDQLICKDPKLVLLHKQMSEMYHKVLTQSLVSEASVIKETQKNWLESRTGCLTQPDVQRCLVSTYDSRLDNLNAIRY